MQILLFQTLLKGHEKKIGLDDESSAVFISGVLGQALCTVQGTRDSKRSWTHPCPQGAYSLSVEPKSAIHWCSYLLRVNNE